MINARVVIVTGASKGLGLALSRCLYQSGYAVVAMARNIKSLQDIQTQWTTKNAGELLALPVDATDQCAVQAAVHTVKEQFGRIDVLINNVGGLPSTGQFQDLTALDWSDCFNLNVMSAVYFCQACHATLAAASHARVVNLSSITAVEPGVFNPHYSACKAAILNLTKHLASAWASDNITVNAIAAGTFDSPSLRTVIADKARAQGRELSELTDEFIGGLTQKIPLGRLGSAEEVADLIAFLVSEQSCWITGSTLCIDGGKHRGIL